MDIAVNVDDSAEIVHIHLDNARGVAHNIHKVMTNFLAKKKKEKERRWVNLNG